MRTTFIDPQRDSDFSNDGYCIVDLLDPATTDNVKSIVNDFGYSIEHDTKYRMSNLHESIDKNKDLYENLSPIFQNQADQFLQNFKLIRIGILDKLPGAKSVSFHQHPNLVDESKYCSLTAWIPLVETTVEMGTLHIVKGSHKIFNHIRTPNDNRAFEKVSQKIRERFSTPVLLKTGQAIIMNDRLIHWSTPNNSSIIRTAIRIELIPREADMSFYYRVNKRELLHFALEEKSYRGTTLFYKKPDGYKLIGKINQPTVHYRNKQFISMMEAMNPDSSSKKRNLFKKLFG